MKVYDGCCGGKIRRRTPNPRKLIPLNPKIHKGVPLIYLGSGYVKLKGLVTGNIYHVSDHRRQFNADTKDLNSILRRRHFILKL